MPRDRREHGGNRAGRLASLVAGRHAPGIGFEIEQPPVDLEFGAAALDRGDHMAERLVVEHAAVDEVGRGRVRVGKLVDSEEARQQVGQVVRVSTDSVLEAGEADRRECAWKAHRAARRERECAVVRSVELIGAVAVFEGEHVTMRGVADRRRV